MLCIVWESIHKFIFFFTFINGIKSKKMLFKWVLNEINYPQAQFVSVYIYSNIFFITLTFSAHLAYTLQSKFHVGISSFLNFKQNTFVSLLSSS